MVDYQHCLHFAKKRYSLYWGTDEAFMMLYTAGNRHYVGSTFNYMSHYYKRMLAANNARDLENLMTVQEEADSIYRILNSHNGIVVGKEIMRLTGTDCGPVRIPLQTLSTDESDMIAKRLRATTLFQYITKKNEMVSLL